MKMCVKELLLRVVSTISQANIIDQSPGKTATIHIANCNRTSNGITCFMFVPFPFTTKNTDYAVSYPATIALSNVGDVPIKWVQQKTTTGVVFEVGTTDCNNLVWGDPTITITFA